MCSSPASAATRAHLPHARLAGGRAELAAMPSTHPARLKFLDRVNYYGQVGGIRRAGPRVHPRRLRDAAGMTGRRRRARASTTTSKSGTTIGSWPSSSASRSPTTTRGRCRIRHLGGRQCCAMLPVSEVVTFLRPARGGVFVDCTVGLGGHARALLEAGAGRADRLDRDAARARAGRGARWRRGDRVELVHADYRDVTAVLDARGHRRIDGMFADLGVSSLQLDADGRGFSFRRDEPLDMRMDQRRTDGGRSRNAATSRSWRT